VKNLLIVAGVAADVALIVLSLVLMLAGYLGWGVVALLAAFALVVAAAWWWRNSPAPIPPAVEELLARVEDMNTTLCHGETALDEATAVIGQLRDANRRLSGRVAELEQELVVADAKPGALDGAWDDVQASGIDGRQP